MECETCRESLSARLDGEAGPDPAVDAHLAGCAACRDWSERAVALTRRLRVRPVPPAPDLTDRIMAAAPPPAPPRGTGWRVALAVVALAQLGLGVGQLFGWHAGSPVMPAAMESHLFNESTAWNVALAFGLGWVAWRGAAGGLLPVFGGFLVLVGAYSAHDLVSGTATAARVLTHGLLLLGFVLMLVVDRRGRPRTGPVTAMPDDLPSPGTAGEDSTPAPARRHRRYALRPVDRRRDAA
ncbi:zf-HC2 domain-containing protein [Actinocatenispora rupis]|uniref:Membrane protein n=1 Tax=Actinocatenispora rupis TaxID=519421 RepID=A0A8J3J3Q5_9ACTN|nr:zf-HC2 domain-containing protein [Actinocatenispora rupis]GID11056.1 membrane protein [Actinocatenispora rupis]